MHQEICFICPRAGHIQLWRDCVAKAKKNLLEAVEGFLETAEEMGSLEEIKKSMGNM